jgi:non-heme chloroperoxidase
MLKTEKNPGGLPISAFDQIRTGLVADRSQVFKDLGTPFYGYNKPGAKISQGVRDAF